jgi:hypothetical protein
MSRYLLMSFFALLMTGCYLGAPPRAVHVPLPPLSDEAVMNVQTKQRVEMETQQVEDRTCPADVKEKDSPKCTVTTREVITPVTKTITTATLGPDAINHAQFRVLTDPGYKNKVARLDELRSRCKRADAPRWIGMTLMLGGLVTTLVGSGKEDPIIASVGGGAFAAGIGSYFIGYYRFNGADCNRARSLYNEIDLRSELGQQEVPGAAQASEMKILANEFNHRHRIRNISVIPTPDASNDGDSGDNVDAPPPPGDPISDEAASPEASETSTPQ